MKALNSGSSASVKTGMEGGFEASLPSTSRGDDMIAVDGAEAKGEFDSAPAFVISEEQGRVTAEREGRVLKRMLGDQSTNHASSGKGSPGWFGAFIRHAMRAIGAYSRRPQARGVSGLLSAEEPAAPTPLLYSAAPAEVALVAGSGLFDEAFYRAACPDLMGDAVAHFCAVGWRDGRDPGPGFQVGYYLEIYPDVAASGMNPLVHWLQYGRGEGRLRLPPEVEAEQRRKADAARTDQIHTPSIIFITHEGSKSGAPMVLLSLLRWIKANTGINFSIVIGADGPLNAEFEAIAPCFRMSQHRDDEERRNALRAFCGVNVQIVYMNTIVAGIYGTHLRFLNAEFITHVHEMEAVFQIFEEPFQLLSGFCRRYLAVAPGAAEAIRKRLPDPDIEITLLPPFIEVPATKPASFDGSVGLPIIYGCGTVESRKGPDLFCDVAVELLKSGRRDFRMRWIGPASNVDLAQLIQERGLSEHVEWLGAQPRPRDFFDTGAMFLLPSREDPFPLVCLEAADRGLPVICFAGAGAMPDFVGDDAGIVVPHLDVGAMARAVGTLLDDEDRRQGLGRRARAKVHEQVVVDVVAPKILDLLPPLTESMALSEYEAYCEVIDRAQIVSFDIFDTLITRLVSEPAAVFDLVEHRHSRSEAAALDLFGERMTAAGIVLGRHQGARDDVSIDDIYREMAVYRDASIEKKTELDVCVPHPLGKRLFDYAKERGKRIFIASDMYLDEPTIVAMLTKCGIQGWDTLFLSSAAGLKKDTGRLYSILIERATALGFTANEILHIGDNWEGDVLRARAAGLQAIRFIPLYERSRQLFPLANRAQAGLSQIGRLWDRFRTQACRLWAEEERDLASNFYMRLGFELSGPLAAMMAMYVKAQADKLGINRIVFMARDGRIIQKAFERLYVNEKSQSEYRLIYAHLSRATVIPATLSNPLTSSDLYFLIEGLQFGQKPLHYFLEKAGLDPENEDVVNVIKNYFVSIDHIPNWSERTKLTMALTDLSRKIYEANAKRRAKLIGYLSKLGLGDGGDIIFVDVGWLLNIQSRLAAFHRSRFGFARIIGIYVGSRDRVDKGIVHSSLLFDGGDPSHYASLIEQNTTLFELLFSSPEPSARQLALTDTGSVEVELKELTYPPTDELLAAKSIHFGAEAFFDRFAVALDSFFPERISKDFFSSAFDALVHSENPEVHAELGNFEVRLGGHHEFVVRENLLKGRPATHVLPSARSESFISQVLAATGAPHITIVTAAGLDNGSTRYRGINFGHSLGSIGFDATLIHSSTPLEEAAPLIARSQAIVFQRCFCGQQNVGAFLDLARNEGIRCVMEIDDLVFPEFVDTIGSVAGGEWGLEEALRISSEYDSMMSMMDGAIVSTPLLREHVLQRFSKPVALYRNRIDQEESVARHPSRGLRLIYAAGTYSHREDFNLIEADLYNILQNNPDVRLSLLGAVQPPERLLGLPNVASYPMLPYGAMLRFIGRHDLMLMPLVDSVFNRAKSNVKLIECAAMGVPVMASPVGEYALAIDDGFTGMLASDGDWAVRMSAVINGPEICARIGANARLMMEQFYQCRSLDSTTATDIRAVLAPDA